MEKDTFRAFFLTNTFRALKKEETFLSLSLFFEDDGKEVKGLPKVGGFYGVIQELTGSGYVFTLM